MERVPAGGTASVHLVTFPDNLAGLARRRAGREVAQDPQRPPRRHRRARTGARGKRIGSSLEAAPIVYVSDPDLFATLVDVDLAEVAITSSATLVDGEGRPRRSASTT